MTVETLFDDLTQFANRKNILTRTVINYNLEDSKEMLDYARVLNSEINMIFNKFLKLPLPEAEKEYYDALAAIAESLRKLHERNDQKLASYLSTLPDELEEKEKGHQMKG